MTNAMLVCPLRRLDGDSVAAAAEAGDDGGCVGGTAVIVVPDDPPGAVVAVHEAGVSVIGPGWLLRRAAAA